MWLCNWRFVLSFRETFLWSKNCLIEAIIGRNDIPASTRMEGHRLNYWSVLFSQTWGCWGTNLTKCLPMSLGESCTLLETSLLYCYHCKPELKDNFFYKKPYITTQRGKKLFWDFSMWVLLWASIEETVLKVVEQCSVCFWAKYPQTAISS